MRGKRILLIIIALILLLPALVLMLRRKREQSIAMTVASAQDGAFLVQLERPAFAGRPIWELPRALFGDGDRDYRFTETSPGAKIGVVEPTHLELSADNGWELVIESDGQGRVLPGTHLKFSLTLPGRILKLNCHTANQAVGHFVTLTRSNSDKLDGSFLFQLPECTNAMSGKTTAGLPTFTVLGSFKGLPGVARASRP
jgi:hypothetical protein